MTDRLGISNEMLDGAVREGRVRMRPADDGDLYAIADLDAWVRDNPKSGPHVIRDLIDVAAVESRLQRANHLSQVGTMAMSVGHDINNPLTYVLSNNEYIRSEILPELRALAGEREGFPEKLAELDELLSEVEEGAEHIRQVVVELAGLSRPTSSSTLLDAGTTIARAIRMAGPAFNTSVMLTQEISLRRPLKVDASALTQVLINVITNAVHAVQGIVDPLVVVRCFEASDLACIEVSDNGAGIPPNQLARVFEPFFTTKPAGEGTGLGLAVCRRLVERMHGTMRLSSTVNEGTCVKIFLPLAEAFSESEPAEVSFDDIAGCRILIVEDEPAVMRSLERMLDSSGLKIALENSASRALERITTTDFDLILCDLMMPSMTGMGLYRKVMRRKPDACSRFVFMTGGPSSEEARAFCAAHSERLLLKPIGLEALVDALVTRHQSPVERLQPCPNIQRCPMFPKFESERMLGIYKLTYCEPTDGTYRRCARYQSMMSGVRPSPRLLPHGEELPDIA